MSKFFTDFSIDKVYQLLLAVLLSLSIVVGFPKVAQADKPVKPIVFDPASSAVNVAAIYETTPETQKDIVTSIMQSSKSFFKKTPGFESFSVLQSEDGTRVIALTQWKDAASYKAYVAQPVEPYPNYSSYSSYSKSSKKEKVTATPVRTLIFEVDKTQTPEGMLPALHGKDALVQFDEFVAKSEEDGPELLSAAENSLLGVTKLYPSPRTAVLFRSIDNTDVAVLTNWGYAEEFTDITKLPVFEVLPDDVDTLANRDEHLYEVVKTISAKPDSKSSKEKSEKD
jgi:heme-degrading monooxygenase HmoA